MRAVRTRPGGEKPNERMPYTKPHLSPELRAQITPQNKRDRKLVAAGVFLLVGSAFLGYNFFSQEEDTSAAINSKLETIGAQTPAVGLGFGERQVLGDSTSAAEEAAAEPEQVAGQPAAANDDFTSYTVKSGDTLFNISQSYAVKWDLIAQFNGLQEPYLLHGGQVLRIPQSTTSAIPDKVYTIMKGDTLASIAKRYNITVNDIIAVNPNLQKSDLISIGQIIKLP